MSLQVSFALCLICMDGLYFTTWNWSTPRSILYLQIVLKVVFRVLLRLRWKLNLHLHVVEQALWHHLFFGQGIELLLAGYIVLLTHVLVHLIKLGVVDHVKRLLCRFSLPCLWEQFSEDKVNCLVLHMPSFVQLLLQTLFISPKLHSTVFFSLPKCRGDVRVVRIWIFPELASEALSSLPVRKQVHREERLGNFLNEGLLLQVVEESKYPIVSLALRLLVNLLHLVQEPLEFALRQLFLLDGLPGHISADSPVALRDFEVQVPQELLVPLDQLVICVREVKVQRIGENLRHILEVVLSVSHLFHWLVPQVHLDQWLEARVLLFPRGLYLVHGFLDSLLRVKRCRMGAWRVPSHCWGR